MLSDESLVAELRSLVSPHLTPYYDTHFNLLRWIQGHPGVSIDKIANRLRHHLRFRASSWDVDSMHERDRDHPVHKYLPVTKCGLSRVIPNCIVHVDQSGYTDQEGIFKSYSITDIIKTGIYDLEIMLANVMRIEKETGQQASVLYVMDAEGVVNSKNVLDVLLGPMKTVSEFMAEHYVELVKHIVVINVPSWATALWTMMKPVMPARTVEKISPHFIFGQKRSFILCELIISFHVRLLSSSNWRDDIVSFMDPSIGPSFWNNDKHSEFLLPVERPPKVPRLEHTESLQKSDKLIVKAGQVHWIEYNLEQGDEISFKITGNGNFGFAIVRVDNEDEVDPFSMCQIYPFISCVPGPLKVPIEDSVIAPQPGLYKMWFSNSKAWWSSLAIQHVITVSKSEKSE